MTEEVEQLAHRAWAAMTHQPTVLSRAFAGDCGPMPAALAVDMVQDATHARGRRGGAQVFSDASVAGQIAVATRCAHERHASESRIIAAWRVAKWFENGPRRLCNRSWSSGGTSRSVKNHSPMCGP